MGTLIGDIWKGRTAEEIIQDQVTIDQAMAKAEAYRQKAREEKKIRKKAPSTKVVEVDAEDETQEAVEEEELIRTWKSSDKFKGAKGSNTYEGSEIGGYSRQNIRGIRIKCMKDKQRTYEMTVPASTKLHEGERRYRFYLAFLHACIENWDKDVDEVFEDREGREIKRIS